MKKLLWTAEMLGVGGAFSDNHTAVLLRGDQLPTVLLDCGSTVPRALGDRCADVDAVLITHLHGDHCGGLEELIWRKLYLHKQENYPPLRVWSPDHEALGRMLQPLLTPFTGLRGEPREDWRSLVDLCPLDLYATIGECHHLAIWGFSFWPTPHVAGPHGRDKPSVGYRLDVGHQAGLVFSGDTTNPWAARNQANPKDFLLHECMSCEAYPGTVHTHFAESRTAFDERTALVHHGWSTDVNDHEGVRVAQKGDVLTMFDDSTFEWIRA